MCSRSKRRAVHITEEQQQTERTAETSLRQRSKSAQPGHPCGGACRGQGNSVLQRSRAVTAAACSQNCCHGPGNCRGGQRCKQAPAVVEPQPGDAQRCVQPLEALRPQQPGQQSQRGHDDAVQARQVVTPPGGDQVVEDPVGLRGGRVAAAAVGDSWCSRGHGPAGNLTGAWSASSNGPSLLRARAGTAALGRGCKRRLPGQRPAHHPPPECHPEQVREGKARGGS